MTFISADGIQFQRDVLDCWKKQTGDVTFQGRLAMRVTAVFPDARKRDLDNLLKATQDALQNAGAFANDSQIKLLIVEQERIEKPGWLEITIGHKPGANDQKSLFQTNW